MKGVLSFLGWFVGHVVRYKMFLFCPCCSSRPSTKYFFPHRPLFRFLCPNRPTSWAGSRGGSPVSKAMNRGDKRTRRVRDRDFVKFERSRRYRDRYRCQSRCGRARDLVFRDPPTPRASPRSLFADRDPPPLTAVATFTTTTIL
jgi:hypothetical protein